MYTSAKTVILSFFLLVSTVFTAAASERILIAYFTWADNTEIIDRDKAISDANGHVWSMERGNVVDTTTTASVLPPGNTPRLASWIQDRTGGDLFSIRVVDQYSCYWDEILERASQEKNRRARPELKEGVSNIDDYDVVFLGFPNWWYTIPMAEATYVETH
ncbi:MAG: flavodoxin, partial [Spirochaetales bacterium]|nr:flavodoxin [Spirochaetales bacterium]